VELQEKKMSTPPKVWLITGASSGLGMELAQMALARGDIVVPAARRTERLESLVGDNGERVLPVALDVTNAESRQRAISTTLERFGRIDVLANIAGRGCNGAAEEIELEQVRELFELNFFGALELTRLALPSMRANKSGHIINLTSICGLVSFGDLGVYSASKYALEAWTVALAEEVKGFGIRTTLVEPGAFRTEFEGSAIIRPKQRIPEYAPVIETIEKHLASAAGKQLGDPKKAVRLMLDAVDDPSAPLRIVMGSDAYSLLDNAVTQQANDIAAWRNRGIATDFEN